MCWPGSHCAVTPFTSKNNARLKQIRSLYQAKGRKESGLFVVEGIRHVGEALQAGAAVEYLCYAPDQLDSPFALELVRQQEALGLPCLAVSNETFASLASKENPQGLLAVVRQAEHRLDQLDRENFRWGVALVSPQDPGNIGTILRTIDAVGAKGLFLLENSADPFSPACVRASMGALFWYPLVRASFADFTAWARRQGFKLYGTSAHASLDYRQAGLFAQPCILVLGSEQKGLSAAQIESCDLAVSLPMRGRVTSLNLGVAAGVVLYAMLEDFERQQS